MKIIQCRIQAALACTSLLAASTLTFTASAAPAAAPATPPPAAPPSAAAATPAAPAATPAAPPQAAAPSAPSAGPITLPAGTLLIVRMVDSVSSQNAPGANFTTKLEIDLVENGVVAVKAGTMIYGKVQSSSQARRATGRSTLDIRLAQMTPHGRPIPIVTSGYAQAGEASLKKVAKGAAVGAIIGNNVGSGDGGAGAAWGAGATMLKPGETLTIPTGALLEFTLAQPVTIPAE